MQANDYIKCVTNLERDQLMAEYELYVTINANCYDLFSKTDGSATQNLYSFHISPYRYVQMLSHAGVERWLVRFGCLPEAPNGENDPRFCLILTGIDSLGSVITPNYQLLKCYFNESALEPGDSGQSAHVVGVSLKQQWTQSWQNLMTATTVPPHILANMYGIIKGYNFQQSDFLLAADSLDGIENEMIEFRIVNHASVVSPAETQPNHTGTIGLMVAHVIPSSQGGYEFEQQSFYYDISSPCPPTCPDPPGGN